MRIVFLYQDDPLLITTDDHRHYDVTLPNGEQRILLHTLDAEQQSDWNFSTDQDKVMAMAIGAYLENNTFSQ